MSDEVTNEPEEAKPSWFQRWVVAPIIKQLKQGTTPEHLSWTISTGVTLGIFPLFGIRAWLCLLVGVIYKLNQPVLHLFKSLMYPVHLALLVPFAQFGQRLYGEPPLDLSVAAIKAEAAQGMASFFHEFGWVILRASTAWLLVAPFLLILVKLSVNPALRRLARK